MMVEYTPRDHETRARATMGGRNAGYDDRESEAQYDRWLDRHDFDVRTRAFSDRNMHAEYRAIFTDTEDPLFDVYGPWHEDELATSHDPRPPQYTRSGVQRRWVSEPKRV